MVGYRWRRLKDGRKHIIANCTHRVSISVYIVFDVIHALGYMSSSVAPPSPLLAAVTSIVIKNVLARVARKSDKIAVIIVSLTETGRTQAYTYG